MKDRIYQFVCSNLDSVKRNTESLLNHLKKLQQPIAKAGAFYILFSVGMAMSQTSSSALSQRSLNNQNMAATKTLNRSCDLNAPSSKMFTGLKQVEAVDSKLLNIYNLTYGVSLGTTPKKEITSQCSPLQCDQMELPLVDKVTTARRDVKNQTLDLSTNQGPKALEVLHIIFDHLNRFYYVGTHAIERDPSRMELKNPVGYHEPTVLRVGSLEKSVAVPGIPKTQVIKWGNTGLEMINILIPKSDPIKPLINSLVKSTTIGTFKTITITRKGRGIPSAGMFWRTFAAQQQHMLMRQQVGRIFRFVHPRQVLMTMHHLQHPNRPVLNLPRQLTVRQIYAIAFMVRANFTPRFPMGYIPRIINTDGRLLIHNNQIKSVSKGVLFESKLLSPFFVLLRRENVWTKYLSEHFEISLRRTESNTMDTSMVEFQINASKIGFEVLNAVVCRTPLIKRASPVVNFVTLFVQEFFPMEVYLQRGKQHSDIINFNNAQEVLRTHEMMDNNREVENAMLDHLITFFQPIDRHNSVTNLTEIHERNFYSVRWMIRYDFDLFGKLAKYTSSKHK